MLCSIGVIFSFLVLSSYAHAQSDDRPPLDDSTISNINWLDRNDTFVKNLWVDEKDKFSVKINDETQIVTFYRTVKGKLKKIGSRKCHLHGLDVLQIEDLNGDGVNEVMFGTGRNMNGNQWFEAFIYVPKTDKMEYAGSFSTGYTVDAKHKTVMVDYSGSWYMDVITTRYKWYGHRLLPEREVRKSLVQADDNYEHPHYIISCYKRQKGNPGKLKLIYKKLKRDNDPKQDELLAHFFDK
jgi:hypothetical protein